MRLTDEDLARELSLMRQEPALAFAAELDQRVAQGFPRTGPFQDVRRRLSAHPPRRVFARVAVAATFVVVVGVAVVESDLGGSGSPGTPVPQGTNGLVEQVEGGAAGADAASPHQLLRAGRATETFSNKQGAVSALDQVVPNGGGIAPGQSQRAVERSIQLTLAAEPGAVQGVADGVVRVTHSYDGIVLSSNVGHAGDKAEANFQLKIPSAHLEAALSDLSGLAHVRSVNEGALDITAPTLKAERRLEDAQARLASLRTQLAQAQAIGDTAAIARLTRQIHITSFQEERAQQQVNQYLKRAHYATVDLNVVSDRSAGNGWTIGDAFDDAGDVLRYAAGIAVVSAAVLLPVALLAALIALAWQAWVRRSREAALGDTE